MKEGLGLLGVGRIDNDLDFLIRNCVGKLHHVGKQIDTFHNEGTR